MYKQQDGPVKDHSIQAEQGKGVVLPELLCPAGTPQALYAAVEGGADAVYLGVQSFNARSNARNFSGEEISSAARLLHAYGAKLYLTLNTQLYDRELKGFLETAYEAYERGVDGLIVADFGGAELIHREIPDIPLHASTQASGHSLDMARQLYRMGYSRMVAARELTKEDLFLLARKSPVEIEVFVHGALCVSASGQCLFSSVIGGRSGNRGECAQPCRLPYRCGPGGVGPEYPLSLKDLSLTGHVTELIESGVRSLKIEGRMKSPEYVLGVTRIWRRLLDEKRNANAEETEELERLFSRNGFTDGYYAGKTGRAMLGIRSDEDKSATKSVEPFSGLTRKVPIDIQASFRAGEPVSAEAVMKMPDGRTMLAAAEGEPPLTALSQPMTPDLVKKNLLKLGDTPFAAANVEIGMDEGLMIPVSRINALRRDLIARLEAQLTPDRKAGRKEVSLPAAAPAYMSLRSEKRKTARFYRPEQITAEAIRFFDEIYLPLQHFQKALPEKAGILMPPVVPDHEKRVVEAMLDALTADGRPVMAGNLGQVLWLRERKISPVGDFRLNICNRMSADVLRSAGVCSPVLSPELSLPQMRDIAAFWPDCQVIVYGRLPLMTLEKCVNADGPGCTECGRDRAWLQDRRGVRFPVLREFSHRNVIYNSVPVWMADRKDRLEAARIGNTHFIFSVESPEDVNDVIRMWEQGCKPDFPMRRIQE